MAYDFSTISDKVSKLENLRSTFFHFLTESGGKLVLKISDDFFWKIEKSLKMFCKNLPLRQNVRFIV